MRLLVNIDHVATLRNARGENYPDPIKAAKACELAGASGIVFHLRGDRRHIKDADAYELKKSVTGILVFEMAATNEMLELCAELKPNLCTLVPEGRAELTTEGGLNLSKVFDDFKTRVFPQLRKLPTRISLFLDPNLEDIQLAAELGADVIELHTGNYANAKNADEVKYELQRLKEAAELTHKLGIQVSGGHGLNLQNLTAFKEHVPFVEEVSIGHALIANSIFDGLTTTVQKYILILKA